MKPVIARIMVTVIALLAVDPVLAQTGPSAGAWPNQLPVSAGQPPTPPVASGLPDRFEAQPLPEPPPVTAGQQHWVALNLSILQPMVGRVQVKVLPRDNNSIWVEAYGGSVLFEPMYGFGVRMMHTARTTNRGDTFMLNPGVGIQILPDWYASSRYYRHSSYYSFDDGRYYGYRNTLYYMTADVDLSWLHDFSDHFGFELGIKIGIAGRLSGRVGNDYPRSVMFSRYLYPLFNLYSGLRF